MTDRVMVFIDGTNLLSSAMTNGVRIDFAELLRVLVNKRKLVTAVFVDSINPENMEGRLRLYETIRPLGYETEVLTLAKKPDSGRWTEKGLDVAVATDMLMAAASDSCDVAILVSGDADYCPAVRGVQSYGKKVEVAAFNSAASSDLIEYADAFIALDGLFLARDAVGPTGPH